MRFTAQYEQQRQRSGTSPSLTSNNERSVWPRGFGELLPSPRPWTSVSVQSSPLSTYSLPLQSKWTVYTAPKCDTEPIRYVTRHFRDLSWRAQIRSVTKIAPKSPFFLVHRIPMVIKSFYFSSNVGNGKKDTKATVFFRTLACVVSLAGVFCMSHNAPPKDPWGGLRNIQKTPARKTIACVADVI